MTFTKFLCTRCPDHRDADLKLEGVGLRHDGNAVLVAKCSECGALVFSKLDEMISRLYMGESRGN